MHAWPAPAAILLAAASAALGQAATAEEVQRLRDEVAALRQRVEVLESALVELGASTTPAAAEEASPEPIKQYAYLQRVELVEPVATDAERARAEELRQEIDRLDGLIAQQVEQTARVAADPAGVGSGSEQSIAERSREYRQRQARVRVEQRAERAAQAHYEQQRARARAELDELRRKIDRRQVIHARRGEIAITIESRGELLTDGVRQAAQQPITWSGDLLEADRGHERWVATSVRLVDPSELPADAPQPSREVVE